MRKFFLLSQLPNFPTSQLLVFIGRYKAVFVNKLSDAMQEASETQTWLEFALACNYIDRATFDDLFAEYENILGKLNKMDMKADSFCF